MATVFCPGIYQLYSFGKVQASSLVQCSRYILSEIFFSAHQFDDVICNHTTKRTDYLSWEEYFMGVAHMAALRSKDPVSQVYLSSKYTSSFFTFVLLFSSFKLWVIQIGSLIKVVSAYFVTNFFYFLFSFFCCFCQRFPGGTIFLI